MDTHCPTDNEDSFFLPSHPLYHLVSTLGEGVPAGLGTGDTVQLEERRHPRQRYRLSTDAMMHFEMGVLRVYAGVERVVQGEKSPPSQQRGKAGVVGWHGELNVCSRFVQEVTEDGARDDFGRRGSASTYYRPYGCHAAVGLEFLHEGISHLAEVVEAFLVGTDEQYGYIIWASGFIHPLVLFFPPAVVSADEADVHVEVAVFIEAGKAERYPILSTTCFDSSCLEKHIENELQIARMQRVLPWPDDADQPTTSYNQAIQ